MVMVSTVEPTIFWLIMMIVKKKSRKKEEKIAKSKNNSSGVVALPPEKSFDFGGLPDRNLKKNLGCG